MTTTNEAFEALDENLKLDPDEREAAQTLHGEITDLLKSLGLIVSAFLQGSFARKTMIAPLRDVDKVVILHPDLADLTPDQVMDRIEEAIAERYPNVEFNRSRHALQIDFGPTTFYFDTVPAWETSTNDDDVLIANRDRSGWDRSNTRSLIRVVAERNGHTDGLFIHQVRMAKQAVKHLLDGIVPGLHVESWAYIAVAEALAYDEAVVRILETGARLIGSTYTDPTGVDTISARLKPDIIATAQPVLANAARRALEARELADDGDHNEAIRIWHDLFGDCFPPPDDQSDAEALRRSFEGGSVTASGTVARTSTSGQSSRPVRPWRVTPHDG